MGVLYKVYDSIPRGMVDLWQAEKDYGVPVTRLQHWVRDKRLPVAGRLRGPAPGGGLVLVARAELEQLVLDPPRRGPQVSRNA